MWSPARELELWLGNPLLSCKLSHSDIFLFLKLSKPCEPAENIIKINLKKLHYIFIYELWTIYINNTISLQCEVSGKYY